MRTLTFFDEISQEETSYLLPGKWDELTTGQLLFLVKLVDKNISVEEIKLKMLLFCMKGRVRRNNIDRSFRIKASKKYFDLSAEELYAICEIFDYLFAYKDEQPHINPLLIRNPLPVLRVGWVKLYGPADGLTDLSYQQFMELQIAHAEAGDSEKEISKFLSMIYKRKNGSTSKWFRFVPNNKKVAILWFYLGCLNFLQDKFPLPFSGSSGSGDVADGQMRIIDALAKNDVTKKELVRKSDLYEAFYTMQIAAEENEKLMNKD